MAVRGPADTSEIAAFAARIGNVPALVQQAAKDAIVKSSSAMEKMLQRNTPVSDKAPHLKSSIKLTDGEPSMFEKIVSIGDNALIYALSVEYGHRAKDGSHVPANPFYVPVRRIINKQHSARMRRVIRAALKQVFP